MSTKFPSELPRNQRPIDELKRFTANELKNILIQTYKSIDYQTSLRRKLTTLKQVTSVECYIQEFDKTISQMDSRSEDFFFSEESFHKWIKIGRQVSMNRPSTYEQAKQVAISVVEVINLFLTMITMSNHNTDRTDIPITIL